MAIKMPIGQFVSELNAAYARRDGYIMGAYGQNPRTGKLDLNDTSVSSSWKENGYYFTQYSGSQKTQALKWRKNCTRVWDCNGLAEGIYQMFSGVSINTRARNNYSEWCSPKGSGTIPAKYRVPGAAVFKKSTYIHHVGYLVAPVKANNPSGDWYIIEAKGVMYGVVKTKLYDGGWNYWGWMTKYFDYGDTATVPTTVVESNEFEILKKGSEGSKVTTLQKNLVLLGYKLPKYGADGDFGDETAKALKAFQSDHGLEVDGEYGPLSDAAMKTALSKLSVTKKAIITGGSVYVRKSANTLATILGVVRAGTELDYMGEDSVAGWHKVVFNGKEAWVSGKYSKIG